MANLFTKLLTWKAAALLAAILAVLLSINHEAHDPTVSRAATSAEQKQTQQALSGWSDTLRKHK